MRRLVECPSSVTYEDGSWRGSLREPKGGVQLALTADRPFALHLLDLDSLFAAGPRSDGVLVVEDGSGGLVCFLELKGSIDPDDPGHPFLQIQRAIEHFAPTPAGSHGDVEHHADWRGGEDLPVAPRRGRGRPTPLAIEVEHSVAGAVLVMRGGTRHAPRWLTVSGRPVFVAVIQRHGARGSIAMTVDELETALP